MVSAGMIIIIPAETINLSTPAAFHISGTVVVNFNYIWNDKEYNKIERFDVLKLFDED
jgi:hypothetical protein